MRLAKQNHIAFILIGHVDKEKYLAGPKTLEHMVDGSVFGRERFANLRILRCVKTVSALRTKSGYLKCPAPGFGGKTLRNYFWEDTVKASGNAITGVMEGSRALLIEIQALTSPSIFGYPKRTTTGYDANRLQLIIAILSKRAGLNLFNLDVFINVVGGIKIDEPAGDLAVALAIVSSIKDIIIDETVIIGELGLSGEVRFVSNLEKESRSRKIGV